MPIAAIDLGSNSALLTIIDDDGRLLHDEARVVGLGKGLGDRGRFAEASMAAAEAALTDYAQTARLLGVAPLDIRAVTTSAARRAVNANEWFSHIATNTGIHFRIISGVEEAQLTWAGVTSDISSTGRLIAFDLGGGSTEVVIGTDNGLESRVSLEIGSVRHTEAFLGMDHIEDSQLIALKAALADAVSTIPFDLTCSTAIGVAGTVTTLAAMDLGLSSWDAALVHKSTLSLNALEQWSTRLSSVSRDERKRLAAVSPKRADYLIAGAEILIALLKACGQNKLTVSDRGLRYGLISPH